MPETNTTKREKALLLQYTYDHQLIMAIMKARTVYSNQTMKLTKNSLHQIQSFLGEGKSSGGLIEMELEGEEEIDFDKEIDYDDIQGGIDGEEEIHTQKYRGSALYFALEHCPNHDAGVLIATMLLTEYGAIPLVYCNDAEKTALRAIGRKSMCGMNTHLKSLMRHLFLLLKPEYLLDYYQATKPLLVNDNFYAALEAEIKNKFPAELKKGKKQSKLQERPPIKERKKELPERKDAISTEEKKSADQQAAKKAEKEQLKRLTELRKEKAEAEKRIRADEKQLRELAEKEERIIAEEIELKETKEEEIPTSQTEQKEKIIKEGIAYVVLGSLFLLAGAGAGAIVIPMLTSLPAIVGLSAALPQLTAFFTANPAMLATVTALVCIIGLLAISAGAFFIHKPKTTRKKGATLSQHTSLKTPASEGNATVDRSMMIYRHRRGY